MKIAVLSDVHGNFPALQTVTADVEKWQPDRVIVAGDVVNGGPRNDACWRLLRQRQETAGWQALRGNHEDYVIEWANPAAPRNGAQFDLSRLSHWTYGQLNGEVAALAALPDRYGWQAPNGSTLLVLHASVWGNRAGIYPHTPAAEMRRRLVPYPTVFVTAHTHVPFVRQIDATLLVNVGSVGLPGDGDGRAGYGRLTWTRARGWRAEIVRLAYDRDQTERDFTTTGFLAEAGPGALLTLVELRTARDAKTRWAQRYRQPILAGEISMAASVREFLAAAEFRPFLGDLLTRP